MNWAWIAAMVMVTGLWLPVAVAQPAKGWRIAFLTVGPAPKALDPTARRFDMLEI